MKTVKKLIPMLFALILAFSVNVYALSEADLTLSLLTDDFSGAAIDTAKWSAYAESPSYNSVGIVDGKAAATIGAGGTAASANKMARLVTNDNMGENFSASFKLSLNKGTSLTEYAGFYIRYQDSSNFYALEWSRRLVANVNYERIALVKNGYAAGNAITTIQHESLYLNGWDISTENTYKVVAIGNNIKIYVNGISIIDYTDNSAAPITDGKFGIFNYSMYGIMSTVYLDDVAISGPAPSLPAFEAEQADHTYYENNFDTANANYDEVMHYFKTPNLASLSIDADSGTTDSACLDLTTGLNAEALPTVAHTETLLIGDDAWENYVAKMSVKISDTAHTTGMTEFVNLFVRGDINSDNAYTLSWSRRHPAWLGFSKNTASYTSSADNTSDYISSIPVSSISGYNANGYNTYKFIVNGNNIQIYINNMYTPVLDYTDTTDAPITCGGVGIKNYTSWAGNDHILIDDVSVKGTSPNMSSLAIISDDAIEVIDTDKVIISARAVLPDDYEGAEEGTLYVAIYLGNKLYTVTTGTRALSGCYTDRVWLCALLPENHENFSAAAFLWTSDGQMKPLCSAKRAIPLATAAE